MTSAIGSVTPRLAAAASVGVLRSALEVQQLMTAELLAMLSQTTAAGDSVQISAAALAAYRAGG